MKKNLKNKSALIFAVLLICLYGIFGTPSGFTGKALLDSMTKRIHLGLDLQGGVHLVVQVEVLEAVSDETDSTVARIKQDLKAANLTFSQVYKPDPAKPEQVRIEGLRPASASAVSSLLDQKYSSEYDLSSADNDTAFTLTMKPLAEKALEEKLGVSEPKVAPYSLGANQILVELPGISNTDQVKTAIQSTARLEIHAVIGTPYPDEQSALQANNGALPSDEELAHYSGITGTEQDMVYVLSRAPVISGSDFRSAEPGTNQNTGQQQVRFTLTDDAGNRFYDFTKDNVGKEMAVLMGGRIRSVANIKEPIHDQGEIEGSFSLTEVQTLSKLLQTGALPASLVFLQESTVGASLGADSIREGVTAAVVGVLVVMAFMLIYYRSSGINADLALFLNLVILLGFMGYSGATLTLPGIAGVILTIGMGVDSNVLIFERIREEIRAGKAASAAVDQGFAHAWVTIVDTHVTTIVSAAILFLFGSGPVKGFAVTLTFGLLANLFTAVYVSRVIFEAHLNKLKTGEMVSI
jgi:preprotein translocase subunit SecD